ncbi:DUF2690 domain-containing protein [Actinomadura sp. DC4]|uniref:DUF2690 domain-containing protein n=1 Tax=Actinomadura sp. DC4 TaxID=3055069 RepID=UPI0025B26D34|nr:DUF2690 domain-containing protein [Actinomadura sp. DC4]MDN3358164.1 DUF2690 domain-containing protein [Actinomadura sp. DC4]
MDSSEGPAQHFAAELRRLRTEAGNPPYRELAKTAHFSKATLSAAAAGHRLPTWDVTRAYVLVCGGSSIEWQSRWERARAELGLPVPPGPNGATPPEPPAESADVPRSRRRLLIPATAGVALSVLAVFLLLHPRARLPSRPEKPVSATSEPLGRFMGGTDPIADDKDPKKTRCSYDPAVITIDRVEVNTADEHYLGEAELRYSPRCRAVWGRFTPSAGMAYLKNATVSIAARRPGTGTRGVPYTTRFDGQAVFGNILTRTRGCVLISVTVTASTGGGTATTGCRP